jgi:6-phosphogluconolactonase
LTKVGDISTTGEPGALTTDPKRRFLFAALRSTGELAAFRIEPDTGKLTHINTVAGGADPAHINVDKKEKFLFTAYYIAGQITVHSIADDGALGKKPGVLPLIESTRKQER